LLLARTGKKVCVLERHTKAGGYLHNFSRYGETFDTGGHYVGALDPGEPFRILLEYLGVFDESDFSPLARDGFDVLTFPSFQVAIPSGYNAVVQALSSQFPGERAAISRYFDAVRDAVRYFPTYRFSAGTVDNDNLLPLLERSLADVVESMVRDPRLKSVLYAYSALHGVAPRDVSFGLNALVVDALLTGAYGFGNGGDRLANRFIDKLASYGGTVVTGVEVSRLVSDGERITAVESADGRVFTGDLVISGIHPKQTFRMLDGFRISPAFNARLRQLQESIGILGIYAGCKEPPPFDADRNYYVFGFEDPEMFNMLASPPASPDDMPTVLFVSRPDRRDITGKEAYPLTVHAPAPYSWFARWKDQAMRRKNRDYYLFKFDLAQRTLAALDAVHPRTLSCISRYDVSTPLSNLRFNGSEEGSAYGIYHSIRNTGVRAMGPMTHVKNLMITGQSSLFPGLMGAAISGLRTAGTVVGIKHILKDLQQMGHA
jgi:phytoene dehydrogenase-like protein